MCVSALVAKYLRVARERESVVLRRSCLALWRMWHLVAQRARRGLVFGVRLRFDRRVKVLAA